MKIVIIVFLLCASSVLSRKMKNDTLGDKCKKSCEGWLEKPAECNKTFTVAMWSRLPADNKMEDPKLVQGRLYDSKSGTICVCTDGTKFKKRALLFLKIENDEIAFNGVEVCKSKDQVIFKTHKWLNKPKPVEKPVTKKGGKKGGKKGPK